MAIQPVCRLVNRQAFTLVELIATLAVTCVVITLSIPGYKTLAAGNLSAALNTFAAHLHLARSEAIKRGIQVILCPSTDGKTCVNDFQWQNGIMIYADTNQNRKPDKNDQTLRFYQPDSRRIRILTSSGRKKLIFKPSGMSPGSTVTITICDITQWSEPKAIIVSNTGRPRLAKTRPDGSPLVCS